jgi:hypothetical protein
MLEDSDNLPEWVQSKITLAEDYISTVANYMTSEMSEEVKQMNESGGDVVYKKGEHHIEKYGEDSFALYKDGKKSKYYTSIEAAKEAMKEDVEQVEEGMMKRMATDAEEDKRLGSWRKETPWMKVKKTVTDKSGAKHTAMSRAKDLAKQAAKKTAGIKENTESLDESRQLEIVREAMKTAKKKKETTASEDKFEAEPELTSQIVKVNQSN